MTCVITRLTGDSLYALNKLYLISCQLFSPAFRLSPLYTAKEKPGTLWDVHKVGTGGIYKKPKHAMLRSEYTKFTSA